MRPVITDPDAPVYCETCGVKIEYWPGFCMNDVAEGWDLMDIVEGAGHGEYNILCDNCSPEEEVSISDFADAYLY